MKTMKTIKAYLSIIALVLIIISVGCSKKSDSATPTTNNTNTNTNTSPYYFRFTLNSSTDTINGDDSKSYTENTNAILGIISSNDITLSPAMTLRFSLPVWYDTVKESDVMSLAGKTIYFTDTIMAPDVEYQQTDTSETWYSQVVTDTSFNIKVTSIVFLDSANYQGYPVRNYVITGTCKAQMHQTPVVSVPMTGSFKMVLSRVTY